MRGRQDRTRRRIYRIQYWGVKIERGERKDRIRKEARHIDRKDR